MASSSSNKFHHARSNSLPPRPHPAISRLEKFLHSLSASETNCSTSSLTGKISGLEDLHECVDKLLLLPLVQKVFTQQNDGRSVDALLDGSLRLLDLCSTAKNSLLQSKETLQELQSSLRRRKGGENVDADRVRKYLSTRKSVKKAMRKAISSWQSRTDELSTLLHKGDEAAAFISLLMEVGAASSSVFKSVLGLVSGSSQHKPSSFSPLISKVMLMQRVAPEAEKAYLSVFSKQDMALESIIGSRTGKVYDLIQVEQLQNSPQDLETDIQDLEEGLESMYRMLIKSRVSLLNILSN